MLTGLGVLARFRPRLERGSAPWHYVLDTLGAMVLAAEDDDGSGDELDRVRLRRDKSLAISSSPRLGHLVGCNGFFTALARTARESQAQDRESTAVPQPVPSAWQGDLEMWWSARRIAAWIGDLVRPDAYGRWREVRLDSRSKADGEWEDGIGAGPLGGRVDFFVEYDTGTENHTQLARKLSGYQRAAESLATEPKLVLPWVLFVFTRLGREAGARRALDEFAATSARHGELQLPIATGVFPAESNVVPDTGRVDPAGPLWLPLDTFAGLEGSVRLDKRGGRLRLAQLPPHYPPGPDSAQAPGSDGAQ